MYGALKYGGAAIGGGLAGYEVGRQTTNRGGGALGGALAGAGAGYAMAGPIGAAAGAVAGLIGGFIGSGKAAKEAAREMGKLQQSLKLTMDALRARDRGDNLAGAIAGARAEFDKAREEIKKAYGGRANEPERFRLLKEIDGLEARRLDKLRQEFALLQQMAREDLEVRYLAASGRTGEADTMRKELEQARELRDAEMSGMDQAYLARLREVHALEKSANALERLTTELNTVSGYKLQATIFGAMFPRGGSPGSTNPRTGGPRDTNPSIPLDGGDLTVNVTLPDGSVLASTVVKNLKQQAARQFGDTTRWSEVQ